MDNCKVAISSDFLSAFAALPKPKQGKVMDFITKFRNNPTSPGINYEKLKDAFDINIRSVRIDEAYRGIVMKPDEGNVYLLLWVAHHDDAYNWARRKKCVINPETGSVQVFDVQEEIVQDVDNDSDRVETIKNPPLFAHISVQDLLRIGVPADLLPSVNRITEINDLHEKKDLYPHDAFEALELIADGFEIDEIIQELFAGDEQKQVDDKDFNSALENAASKQVFHVVEGEQELVEILAAPLEKWRVFLHPSQRRIVEREFNGPARVMGGAGTGKTVVAMHRAKWLAQHLNGQQRILFTTFTVNLANDIYENIKKICDTNQLKRIEIVNLDAWVRDFLKTKGYDYKIIYGEQLESLWDQALTVASPELGLSKDFYTEEWYKVIKPQEVATVEDYVTASRVGRGTRLDRKARIEVWNVFHEMGQLMDEKRVRDPETAMVEARYLLDSVSGQTKYSSIIIDEAQDLSASALKLLRTLAGAEHKNDLFIVGDSHQRIYRNKAALSKCGINIRGRSKVLRINYRTTEEIRRWAVNLLNGISFDDLDDGHVDEKGYKSLISGPAPDIKNFTSFDEEVHFIIQRIKQIEGQDEDPKNICIVARTNRLLDLYIAKFNQEGIRTYQIKRSKTDDRYMPGVRLATMHRVKGLEFDHMVIAAVNKNEVPLLAVIQNINDKITEKEMIVTERSLLYVSLTRAKQTATITSYGNPSEFL